MDWLKEGDAHHCCHTTCFTRDTALGAIGGPDWLRGPDMTTLFLTDFAIPQFIYSGAQRCRIKPWRP